MAFEIERKFLVNASLWHAPENGMRIRQGYVPTKDGTTVRIRIAGAKACLTLKDHAIGLTRHEFEYEIPVVDAGVHGVRPRGWTPWVSNKRASMGTDPVGVRNAQYVGAFPRNAQYVGAFLRNAHKNRCILSDAECAFRGNAPTYKPSGFEITTTVITATIGF